MNGERTGASLLALGVAWPKTRPAVSGSVRPIRFWFGNPAALPSIRSIISPTLNSVRGSLLIANRFGQIFIPHNAGLTLCDGLDCRNYGAEIGLRGAEVLTAFEDREGSLWIGYSGYGLARSLGRDEWQSFAEQEGLANPGVWRIARDASGILWVGTSRGLFRGSLYGGRVRFQRSDVVGELTVYGMRRRSGRIALGRDVQSGANGLIRYDTRTGRKTVFRPSVPDPQFSITDVVRDEAGSVWVATPHGVLRLAPGATALEKVPGPLESTVFTIAPSSRGLFIAREKDSTSSEARSAGS